MDPTGFILIGVGILLWIKPLVTGLITLQNKLRGSQTNITSLTIWYYRLGGLIAIVIGCVLVFGKN